MAMLQRISAESSENENKSLYHVKHFPAIDEDKDKKLHQVWSANEVDRRHKIRVDHHQDFSQIYSLEYFVNFVFYYFFKCQHDNFHINVWKPRNVNVPAQNYLYKLKRDRISPQDWLKRKCLIFDWKIILVYLRLIFYVPVYISSDEDLLFKQKSKDLIDKLTQENEDLKKKNISLKQKLNESDDFLNARTIRFHHEKIELCQERVELMEKNRSLQNELRELKIKYEQLKLEHQETLHDLGKLSVERATDVNKTKKVYSVQKILQLKKSSTHIILSNENGSSSTSECEQKSTNKSSDLFIPKLFAETPVKKHEASNENACEIPGNTVDKKDKINVTSGHLSFPVKEAEPGGRESVSFTNYEPCSVITAEMRNMYKMLVLTIADRLLFSDTVKLKEWAKERFSIQNNLNATEIMFHLDHKGAISAFDLDELHAFFESILRFDLIYLIDQFSSGDYPCLRKLLNSSRRESQMPKLNQVRQSGVEYTYSTPKRAFCMRGNAEVVSNDETGANERERIGYGKNPTSSDMPTTSATNVVKVASVSTKDRTAQNTRKHCNGTSHFSPDNSQSSRKHDVHEEKWLCSHYKRRCYVKFECCNKFWPCHRCHNNESNCGRKKLKSRDTKMVKCVECGEEQQFGENNQFCISCNVKFADFYCGLCKHLTGMDDYPYHCNKCGICRIHGDRSFHCDVCGVCLDVKLRGNHKCREGSAHDECFICMEDAFTGCQILPCSHKVHKNCATQMIQRGITRCPICRESFAHMLTKGPSAKKNTKKR